MEYHWLRREGSPKLVIFVLGWAADWRLVEHIRLEGCDVLAFFDYRDGIVLSHDCRAQIEAYSDRRLFAWSFGVLATEYAFAGVEFNRAVALNGTPFPVSERYGIEPRRMSVTIRGLKTGGMEAFDRRAYESHFESLSPILSPRTLQENIAELEYLVALAAKDYTPSIEWSKAIIGSDDKIFSTENMLAYWGTLAEVLPLPHYPFADGRIIEKELGDR